jgi:PIN domain nuclease of toxin-antitoxin system
MVLLDTHVVVWLALEPNRLSRAAVIAIENARATEALAISPVTLAEVANLVERQRIEISISCESFLQELASRFVLKHMNVEIALLSSRFSEPYPGDPMDRIIGATALSEGIPLVTADERIRQSGQVQTIW